MECVIADTCIGGAAEAAACAEKFRRENVGVSLTVTPCWCYGAETMDMDPLTPKAVWGFNGTERPGAVYLAAVLAAHSQKGLPAFGIYGRDVQDAIDREIPEDVKEKILRFTRAALAVAWARGKSYLAIGGVSMGIAGSIVDPSFLESYLGMRYEMVDTSEFIRRMDEGIYDQEEYERALEWVRANCVEGEDRNPPELQPPEKKDATGVCHEWSSYDLMIGNPRLAELGFGEEALGHNAIAAGFQGQRQWTDHFPNGDFLETILNSSFDWNGIREPFVVATENDYLNGIAMLFGHLLTGTAQIFSDVRTYWSRTAVSRVTGYRLTEIAENGIIHLINSGSTALDGTGQQSVDGKPVMKQYWEITPEEVQRCLKATTFRPASGILPRRRLLDGVHDAWRHACDHVTGQSGQGPRSGSADRRRIHRRLARSCEPDSDRQNGPDLADNLVCACLDGSRTVPGCLLRHEQLGSEPRSSVLRSRWCGSDNSCVYAADPRMHAQRA